MEYSFTLKYQLSALDCDHDDIVERLGAAGCDDALIGIGLPGRVALEFLREEKDAEAALISALADIKNAVPTATLIEAATVRHLAEVLGWLQAKGSYPLAQAVIDVAATAMQINLAKGSLQISPRIQQEIQDS